MSPTVLFVQTGFVTYPRQGEKPEVRMSEHEMILDLEFAPKMLCVTVKRYADDVVVMRSRWCNEDDSRKYGSESMLFEIFIKDFEAIRRGIETFDRDMQNKLWLKPPVNGKYIVYDDAPCTCLPDGQPCPSCVRKSQSEHGDEIPF